MKNSRKVSAIPSKRLYQSIIADYDIQTSLCELIDNAIDVWVKNGKNNKLEIKIFADTSQQTIKVLDNAGGIHENDIKKIIAPGHTSNEGREETIGVFGVGSKRAVVALAQKIKILTRNNSNDTLVIQYDDDWLQDEDWDLEYQVESNKIEKNTTIIELSNLRSNITDDSVEELKIHFGSTYSKFLSNKNLSISVNTKKVESIPFDSSWSYPPHYAPQKIKFDLNLESDEAIQVEILGGLVGEDQIGEGEYGVYFYCNDRLILKADKSYDFGFSIGQAGLPHSQLNPMRVIVNLYGNPQRMPWNSSKSGINFRNKIFQLIRPKILQLVVYYAKLARKFVGDVQESIYQYNKGKIEETILDNSDAQIKLYSLPPPLKKADYAKDITVLNEKVSNKKPWVIGLYEGIILVDNLNYLNLVQKNRFALIILDSTLEIAFKEFLTHDTRPKIGKSKLLTLLQNRTLVEAEILVRVKSITNTEWGLINHYYGMRNNLIHQVATSDVKQDDIAKYRTVVERILKKLFNLKFK